jgi:hypothetical protein
MRSSIICNIVRIGRVSSESGDIRKASRNLIEKLKERDRYESIRVNGRMLLKWI